MSNENNRDHDKMRLFVQAHSEDIDRRIAETQAMLENSRRFLESIREGERRTRDYLTELIASLEKQIERLNRDRDRTIQ